MRTCQGCGGVLGRDCYNEQECIQITRNLEDSNFVEPYIDALKECRYAINWMINNMSVDDENMQSDSFNITANVLDLIDRIAPRERTPEEIQRDLDELPF